MSKKIPTQTIIRAIVLLVTLVNTVLTIFGKNPLPFAEEELYAWLTAVATVAATLWAWWKNNSFTPEAIQADKYLAELKANNNTETETEE
uniref:phage holin n=1 Tax=Alistipes sp. TaxID=1872444 RepID=UPI0040568620